MEHPQGNCYLFTVMGFLLAFLSSALWSPSRSSRGVGKLDGLQELLSLFSSPRGAVTMSVERLCSSLAPS